MGAMVDVTEKCWMRDLQHHVRQPHPITGHMPYTGSMVDKVTDKGTKQWQVCCISFAFRGRRMLALLDFGAVTYIADNDDGVDVPAAAAVSTYTNILVRL